MSFDKSEILNLSAEERRTIAFELLDSIDEEFINESKLEWKEKLIRERVENDIKDNLGGSLWSEVKKKYYRRRVLW